MLETKYPLKTYKICVIVDVMFHKHKYQMPHQLNPSLPPNQQYILTKILWHIGLKSYDNKMSIKVNRVILFQGIISHYLS